MEREEFLRHGHALVDWIADYLDGGVRAYPVRAQVAPGEIRARLPAAPPEAGEPLDAALADFHSLLMPGVTHWQHPRFFAYFPANTSYPSVLGELLAAGLGAQGMVWETSPAVTELEEVVIEWLRQMLDLPVEWRGVIQDTASTATLTALLCARERVTDGRFNQEGAAAAGADRLVVYASSEAHSSLEKGAKIAGFGRDRVRKLPVDGDYALDPAALAAAVAADLAAGLIPACAVGTVGTTGSTALDPLRAVGGICRRHGMWFHVDGALAGTAAIVPELRWILDGIELADSFVFNPHKWMFTNFDCSAYFVRDPDFLVRTLAVNPEYLRTAHDGGVSNFRDWHVQLGRRFRALKLWFVIRSFGVEGIRERVRRHVAWAHELRGWIAADPDFELLAPTPLNLVCWRWCPPFAAPADLDALNERLLTALNDGGELYLSHTRLGGAYTLRLCVGQTTTTRDDVVAAWAAIRAAAARLGESGDGA
jgi:aromatic-L-amino-acid decarboxylase